MKRNRKGFTLIELLVVIAIIAILAAILFPIFVSATQKSKSMSCLSNMKQITTAHSIYIDDYEGALVPIGLIGVSRGKIVPANGATYWPDLLANLTGKNGKINRCPTAPKCFGIGMNHPQLGRWVNADASKNPPGSKCTLGQIRHPSQTVCFADTGLLSPSSLRLPPDRWTEVMDIDPANDLTFVMRTPDNVGYYDQPASATRPMPRHGGRANCAFVDGHCASMMVSQLGLQKTAGDPKALWDMY
jgi:prepilin-type N-terminal cleavage/methylation domain-containing protein/prepilin-type processing-associated H-X9-DG protein